jgi:hypothetical protein
MNIYNDREWLVVDQRQNLEESPTPKPRTTCISLVYVIISARLLFGLERYGIKDWLGKPMDSVTSLPQMAVR